MEAEGPVPDNVSAGSLLRKKHEFTPVLPMCGEDATENTEVTDAATNTGTTRTNATCECGTADDGAVGAHRKKPNLMPRENFRVFRLSKAYNLSKRAQKQ